MTKSELTIKDALLQLEEMDLENADNEEVKSCYIHITQDCNLACPYCYSENKMRNKHTNLDVSSWKNIVASLKQVGFERLAFSL